MKNIVKYLHEAGQLTRVANSGYWLVGMQNPPSVAEHVYRASTIAFVLAKLENADAEKAASIVLFHDMQETRINDLHKVAQKYIDLKKVEVEVLRDQLMSLPNELASSIKNLQETYKSENTPEGIIARDADLLDYGFKAKELIELGYKDAQNHIDNITPLIKTESAKKLLKELDSSQPNDWWKDLKKIER
tara:strand:+ start:1129 stop:1698 length:570 start_codon:yes stop_codon:yes gene_type:complete